MKLNWVETMDEVLEIALAAKLPRLTEETPGGACRQGPAPATGAGAGPERSPSVTSSPGLNDGCSLRLQPLSRAVAVRPSCR